MIGLGSDKKHNFFMKETLLFRGHGLNYQEVNFSLFGPRCSNVAIPVLLLLDTRAERSFNNPFASCNV